MRSQKNGLAKGGFFSNLRYDAKKNPMLLVMMIPSVAFFLVFNYLPMVGIYYAFTDYNVRKGLFGSSQQRRLQEEIAVYGKYASV